MKSNISILWSESMVVIDFKFIDNVFFFLKRAYIDLSSLEELRLLNLSLCITYLKFKLQYEAVFCFSFSLDPSLLLSPFSLITPISPQVHTRIYYWLLLMQWSNKGWAKTVIGNSPSFKQVRESLLVRRWLIYSRLELKGAACCLVIGN